MDRLSQRLAALKKPGRAGAPRAAARARPARASQARAAGDLVREPDGVEAFLLGGEVVTAHGPVYLHQRTRSQMDKGTARFLRRLAKLEARARKLDCHEELARLLSEGLSKALFLDLETTGLSQSPVFLCGVMTAGRADWTLHQYFARHYAEEKALVRRALELLEERPTLVTFNGRTFDWPFLKTRAAYHRLKVPRDPFHVDLLRHSRRHFRGEYRDCKLKTLEWGVCGRRRVGDVDGAEIPELYHRYVKTGDPYPLAPVFHHNLLDLVTMGDLLVEILEREVGEQAESAAD